MTDPVLTWTLRVLSVAQANRFFVLLYSKCGPHEALKTNTLDKSYLNSNVKSNLAHLFLNIHFVRFQNLSML